MSNSKSDADQPTLEEYASNPFIARLPPLLSQRELVRVLASRPTFNERERLYPAHIRKHCVARLTRYFEPLTRQVQLADRFGLLLRQGYVGRNPLTHDYLLHLHNGAERIASGDLEAPVSEPVENTAASFSLTGCPGMGKSVSIRKILRLYPQLISHSEPFSLIQIVWLRLEAPSQGSLKQLCISFFEAVDKLAGTDYLRRYGASGINPDKMLVYMAQVAQLHALGVLVVDEIQHLEGAKVGPEAVLKFLVTLVNTIGVPVILIGTLQAIPLLQGNFSEARRATGLGSINWDRMLPGKDWDYFINRMWHYQWLREPTHLTPEISKVLYDLTQGVIALTVILFLLAQLRLLSIIEIRAQATESLSPTLLRRVAREEFGLVQPMLQALRTNDLAKLEKFGDLLPLQNHVDRVLADALESPSVPESVAVPEDPPATPPESPSPDAMILGSLKALGVADDVAQVLLKHARAENPSDDPLLLMAKLAQKLSAKPIKLKKPTLKAQTPETMPASDLRRLVAEGKIAGKSGYDALLEAGVIRPPMQDFAA